MEPVLKLYRRFLNLVLVFKIRVVPLPRHLIGLSASVGIDSPCNLKLRLSGAPFFRIRLRDLLGLNVNLAHFANSSKRLSNQRMAISASVIAVMSSINARHGGC